ncbi:MAG: RNase P subunit p30 family protein [Halodesulfurarchaeum sp.]|nr:RNase P subunit p30 family protein [Halodesulfurarchaeum sp.]
MYDAVHVESEATTTPGRFALTVSRAGFDGMVVRNCQSAMVDVDASVLADRYQIDVVRGIEITARDKATASGAIGNRRPEAEILLVRGRDPELNRFAVESPRVDVLADPMGGDGDVNHVIAEAAARNGVAFEVNLGPVLRESGGTRVRAIRRLRKLRELIEDANAPFVVSGAPRTHLEVRGPRELLAVGEQIGFDREQIRAGLETWGQIAERTRKRRDPSQVAPGVRIEDEPESARETGSDSN